MPAKVPIYKPVFVKMAARHALLLFTVSLQCFIIIQSFYYRAMEGQRLIPTFSHPLKHVRHLHYSAQGLINVVTFIMPSEKPQKKDFPKIIESLTSALLLLVDEKSKG